MIFKRSVKTSKYHVTFVPKYRKSFLKGLIKYWVERSIKEKCLDLDVDLEKIEVMYDHVHLFINIPVYKSISDIVGQIKGYSSYNTRKKLKLYRYRNFWGKGYFCESVGHISEQTIKKYIDDQWKKPNSSRC